MILQICYRIVVSVITASTSPSPSSLMSFAFKLSICFHLICIGIWFQHFWLCQVHFYLRETCNYYTPPVATHSPLNRSIKTNHNCIALSPVPVVPIVVMLCTELYWPFERLSHTDDPGLGSSFVFMCCTVHATQNEWMLNVLISDDER